MSKSDVAMWLLASAGTWCGLTGLLFFVVLLWAWWKREINELAVDVYGMMVLAAAIALPLTIALVLLCVGVLTLDMLGVL